jgi:phosphatidylglycerol---prolipoprotein diacylglyceryl transferase
MHPVFFEVGPLSIHTYGVMVALAFLAALRLSRATARVEHLNQTVVLDLVALLVLSGIIGARIFYVLVNIGYFLQNPWQVFAIWHGGLVFYGGFIVASIAGVFFVRKRGISVGRAADCLAPCIAIGQAIGRWGCFFAGCCYGKPTNLPWGVEYRDPLSLAPLGIRMHPTQLYESFADLLIGLFLWLYMTRDRHDDGQIFWLYVLLYGTVRFAMELLRGDDRGATLGGLYPSQVISLGAMLLACSVLVAQASVKEEHHEPS